MEFREFGKPVLLSLAMVGDDFGGGVLDEGFAREFFGDFFDLGFDFANLAFEAFGFGGRVDNAFEWKVDRADVRRARGMADRGGFTKGDRLGVEQDREDGEFVFHPIGGGS